MGTKGKKVRIKSDSKNILKVIQNRTKRREKNDYIKEREIKEEIGRKEKSINELKY